MLYTARSFNGMAVTPHRLASESAVAVLRKGGNAVEAAVAAAAALCVVYPHMTGLGGDTFWLVYPGHTGVPALVDSCGASAALASRQWYNARGCSALPPRGPLAAMTMAGAVAGWEKALEIASGWTREAAPLTLGDLFHDAIALAEQGFPVSDSQSVMTRSSKRQLEPVPGFAERFLPGGDTPRPGARMRLPELATTIRHLADNGLNSFYSGPFAEQMASALEAAGSPLRLDDFAAHRALVREPLHLRIRGGTLFNAPPPTQGFASLLILALLERHAAAAGVDLHKEAVLVHAIVEATKQAFLLRDRHLGDPAHMDRDMREFFSPDMLDSLANAIMPGKALLWPVPEPDLPDQGGDTVWFGVADAQGTLVSCIQSIYHEFGSGLALPGTGVLWHNRGLGFRFEPGHPNSLAPGKKPFHTLNPAMAVMDDRRVISYGTMGGEGQPQTQAAVFTRAVTLEQSWQAAISAPRWLLGRSWGEQASRLRLEAAFDPELAATLRTLGHETETVPAFCSLMGHAGAVIKHADGLLEGAFDPRSDGSAACW